MIYDGYNRRAVLAGDSTTVRVIYRPALEEHRRQLRSATLFFKESGGDSIVRDFIQRRIVSIEPFDLFTLETSFKSIFRQLVLLVQGLIADDSGFKWIDIEEQWQLNLTSGVKLAMTNPRLANRDCGDCQKTWYNEDTGLPIINSAGEKEPRVGPTLCQTPIGCAKGTPESPLSLNTANKWAWSHFRDCDATGLFPDDPIVQRNARIIRQALKSLERARK